MNWVHTKDVAQSIQAIVSSIALLVVGIWAYYRFIRFRTLKPKLEFSFDCHKFITDQNIAMAIVQTKVSNRGNTKVDLRRDGEPTSILKYGLIGTSDPKRRVSIVSHPSKQLKRIDEMFVTHGWLEPNETIDDTKVLRVPIQDNCVIQLEAEIFGRYKRWGGRQRRVKWSSSTAFQLTGDTATSTFSSEDEQEEYEETEFRIAKIQVYVSKVEEKLDSSALSTNKRNELDNLLDKARALLRDLSKEMPNNSELLKISDRLIQDLRQSLD
jgi:hypothetical protein